MKLFCKLLRKFYNLIRNWSENNQLIFIIFISFEIFILGYQYINLLFIKSLIGLI